MTQPDLPDWVNTISTADAPFQVASWSNLTPPQILGSFDISAFSSLNMVLQSSSPTINKVIDIQFNWFDKGQLIQTDHITTWGSLVANNLTNPTTISLPCRGDSVGLVLTSEDLGCSISGFMFGSRRLIPRVISACDTQNCSPAILSVATHSLAAGVTEAYYLGPLSTGFQWTASSSAAGPLNILQFIHPNVGGTFADSIVFGVNQAAATTLYAAQYLANTAFRITFGNNGAAATNFGATIMPIVL